MRGFSTARLLALTVLCGSLVIADDSWTYKEEKLWPGKCQDGKRQSPINLRKDTAERRVFNDLQLRNYDMKYAATIQNTGHSVAVRLRDSRVIPSVAGGGLPHEYILDHMHFHWDSEHTIHSNRFPLELHFLHYANMYNSTTEGAKYDDGLAVLAVMLDISENDNPAFEPIISHIEQVRNHQGVDVPLTDEVAPLAFLPKDMENFFRYEGSLTTPNCDEAVIWTIFYHVSFISKRQLEYFPSIVTHEGVLKSNYRSLQPLNGRVVVFRSTASYEYSSGNYISPSIADLQLKKRIQRK